MLHQCYNITVDRLDIGFREQKKKHEEKGLDLSIFEVGKNTIDIKLPTFAQQTVCIGKCTYLYL